MRRAAPGFALSDRVHAAFVILLWSVVPALFAQLPIISALALSVAPQPLGDLPLVRPGGLALSDAIAHNGLLFAVWGVGFCVVLTLMVTAGALVTAQATSILAKPFRSLDARSILERPRRFILAGLGCTAAELLTVGASLVLGAGLYASLYERFGEPRATAAACVPVLLGLGIASLLGVLFELFTAASVLSERGVAEGIGASLRSLARAPLGLLSAWGGRAVSSVATVAAGGLFTAGVVWDSPGHGARILFAHGVVLATLAFLRVSWLERVVVEALPSVD